MLQDVTIQWQINLNLNLNFLIHCARHFSSRLHPSGGTCKYAKAPSKKKTLRDFVPIDMVLSAVSVLVVAQSSSEVPERLMNNPVYYRLMMNGNSNIKKKNCSPVSCTSTIQMLPFQLAIPFML